MTQNVDAGTDFGYLVGASTASAFLQGVIFTYEEINASNFAPRAAQLAREIARNRPALVDLQEVALWRTGPLNLACFSATFSIRMGKDEMFSRRSSLSFLGKEELLMI